MDVQIDMGIKVGPILQTFSSYLSLNNMKIDLYQCNMCVISFHFHFSKYKIKYLILYICNYDSVVINLILTIWLISSIFKSIMRMFLFFFSFQFEKPKRWIIIKPNNQMDLSFYRVDNIIFNKTLYYYILIFFQILHFRFPTCMWKIG